MGSAGKWTLRVLVGALLVAGGVAVGWAAGVVAERPEDTDESAVPALVEVVQGSVGSTINLNTVAEWFPTPSGHNRAAGTVTAVRIDEGQSVGVGDVLYDVDLRPVSVAQGTTPAFRDLAAGASGADVEQLERFLSTMGFLTIDPDSEFKSGTTTAVKAWQRSLGLPASGTVRTGDIYYLPVLPVRVSLDLEVVSPGQTLSGGANRQSASLAQNRGSLCRCSRSRPP